MSGVSSMQSQSASYLSGLFSLSGRVALVTGGNAGLGARMAEALAGAGAEVVLVARRADALRETSSRIQRMGGQAHVLPVDLLGEGAVEEVARGVETAGREVDIIVNAAGINIRRNAEDVTQEDWDRVLRLNLGVPFFLARHFAPAMSGRGWGRIINMASLQSVRAFPQSVPYGASKGGIVQLTRAMAEAWSGRGICCNAIAPGLFPTELTASLYSDAATLSQMAARTCCGRNGELEDIAGLTVFLASDASRFVTGQTIFLDGGLTAK